MSFPSRRLEIICDLRRDLDIVCYWKFDSFQSIKIHYLKLTKIINAHTKYELNNPVNKASFL
jgi:hypothetical protein